MTLKHLGSFSAATAMLLTLSLTGCVSNENPCEDILEVKQQEKMCAQLRKTMNNRDYPQQAITAKQRYEQACTNLRYYRDDFDTICKGDKKPIGSRDEK